MDESLEALSDSLFNSQVPKIWSDTFLSLKPLISWIFDLCKRVTFLREWTDYGVPKIFWISGFSFPQGFLTGTLQNYARKKGIAIDRLDWDFKFIDD